MFPRRRAQAQEEICHSFGIAPSPFAGKKETRNLKRQLSLGLGSPSYPSILLLQEPQARTRTREPLFLLLQRNIPAGTGHPSMTNPGGFLHVPLVRVIRRGVVRWRHQSSPRSPRRALTEPEFFFPSRLLWDIFFFSSLTVTGEPNTRQEN